MPEIVKVKVLRGLAIETVLPKRCTTVIMNDRLHTRPESLKEFMLGV